MLASRSLAELGERERAVTALHTAAEGLLGRDYLLSAIAACKMALRINPVEKRVRETLRRIHARAEANAHSKAAGPPPLPVEPLYEAGTPGDISELTGAELCDRAFEVLASGDPGEVADPAARPPLPLFADLEQDAFLELAERMSFRELHEGDLLCAEGEPGESLFVVVAGKAEVFCNGPGGEEKTVGFLTGGALLGEMAVVMGTPRTAGVAAVSDCEIFEISRDDLNAVARSYPHVPRMLAEFAQRRMARNLLSTAPIFNAVPEENRKDVLGWFEPRILSPGDKIHVEGELSTGLFLILAGELLVQKKDPGGGAVTLGVLGEGEVTGEISLLTHTPATATVSSTRKTAVAFLSRDQFIQLITRFPSARAYLESLSQRRLAGISAALLPAEVLDADELIMD
jgi:CRP-like cAMP-binding protein